MPLSLLNPVPERGFWEELEIMRAREHLRTCRFGTGCADYNHPKTIEALRQLDERQPATLGLESRK